VRAADTCKFDYCHLLEVCARERGAVCLVRCFATASVVALDGADAATFRCAVSDLVSELVHNCLDANARLQSKYIAHLRPALEDDPLVYPMPEWQDESVCSAVLAFYEAREDAHSMFIPEETWREDDYGVFGVVDGVIARLGLGVQLDVELQVFELV